MEHIEIERKFIIDINKLPFPLENYEKLEIEQTYLATPINSRVRCINNNIYYFTQKNDIAGDIYSRQEFEKEITREEYDSFLKNKVGNTIYKDRYKIPYIHNNLILEIDIYKENLSGLTIMEVEFNSHDDVTSFVIPDFVVREVTDNPDYKNSYLALYGI